MAKSRNIFLGRMLDLIEAEQVKLSKFQNRYKEVHQALENAEGRRLKNSGGRVWIEKFEEIAYEMEDLLEEWTFKVSNEENSMLKGKVGLFIPCLCLCFNQCPDVFLGVRELERRLDRLWDEADKYQFISGNTDTGTSSESDHEFYSPPTISNIDESEVHGRQPEKECLIALLLEAESDNDGVKVMSIVGAGGSGKTTLAQCLYNDYRVEQYFDVRKWVSVSEYFDLEMVLKTLLEDLSGQTYHRELTGLDLMSELVRKQFSGKKFLLVLDDVWKENRTWFWDSIQNVAPGSIILVTTVSKNVAKQVGSNHEHFLRPLLTWDCWLIIKQSALSGKPQFSKEIKGIGIKFAKQCNGSPLVARIIGGLLRKKYTAQEWNEALDMEVWKNDESARQIYRHLYVSYQNLSTQLKIVFSYCAVFPKDTYIDVERLIRLLLSLGYVTDPSSETNLVKKIGGYAALAMLETMSFLANAKRSIHKNKITHYMIPEPSHCFAEYVRPDLTMQGQLEKLDRYRESRSMRSFVIFSPCQLPRGLFKTLKYVRALVLSCCELEELSSDVASLTFLRFLDVSANPLKELPEAICRLFCLQSLYLHSCYQLMSLPQKIGKLRLRHMRINYTTDELHDLPQGFEKMTSILTLDMFRIGGRYNNVQRLQSLNDLEDIRIAVHGEVNFADADLESKSKLENLELCFVGEGRDQEKALCIEKLVPPPNLEMLKLEDYPRLKLPRWILSESLINKLKRLSLRSAPNISSLPALWTLSSLEFLWLYDIPNITHVGREFFGFPRSTLQQHHSGNENQKTWSSYMQISRESDEEDMFSDYDEEDGEDDQNATAGEITADGDGERVETLAAFCSLKTLRIEYLENLEIWEDVDEAGEKKMKPRSVMPSLEEIIIADCPMVKLEALPCHILGKISPLKITIDGKLVDIRSDSTGDKASSSKGKEIMAEQED